MQLEKDALEDVCPWSILVKSDNKQEAPTLLTECHQRIVKN